MSKVFISHSSANDVFVRELQQLLGDLGQDVWIDSRELRGGDPLWPEIQKAIEEVSAYAVVVSPISLQSEWVAKELSHALAVQKQRGKANFPVIPLLLDATKPDVLRRFFKAEPIYIPVSSAAGGVEAALHPILVALGKREPIDGESTPQSPAQPLEELVLELTDLRFQEHDGMRRASARARLVYEPATPGQRDIASAQSWRFIAPTIEAEELRWYLEKFAIWPSEIFRNRARKVEQNLMEWGRRLHKAALPAEHTADVLQAWAHVGEGVGRRFSVHVDAALEAGAPGAELEMARDAATSLLGLPWELIHDDDGFLFQGARPTRVRRRLPNTRDLTVPVMSPPIRILLVTARPEDDTCGYIDHRASALPLVEAMEKLPGLVRINVLNPPTFAELGKELKRAYDSKMPYHVVHFDGHGAYDRQAGVGGLCFEEPQDIGKLDKRRHATVFANDLGPLLRDFRIPLLFLDACQTAESVASELLKRGVASVVAMSHSVLVETARRFVEAFYDALGRGARVGDAMLDGQRQLKDDTFRARVFGVGELRLEDWFVPVLFQEKEDPQLFRETPTRQTREDFLAALTSRLGDVPVVPATGFVGRSRELLALQRLLHHDRYAVVRGQGGEGKTALAAEFARWMVRSHQVRRAAFVSVETHGTARAVIDSLGRQIVQKNFSAAGDLAKAIQQVERALREQSTLFVVDNMESILLAPFMDKETPEALSEEANRELKAILTLCTHLLTVGDTRIVFTSRESLPAPFDARPNRRELHRFAREDAVKFIERVLNADDGVGVGAMLDAARESIEALIDTVHGHARTLALLAPSLRSQGVDSTREVLAELMAAMEQQFPGSREHSLFASVELSLRRMSATSRKKAGVLGVFFGAVDLDMLRTMMGWEETDVMTLARELIETGLATPDRFDHLTLNPGLCPYLHGQLKPEEHQELTARWGEAMRGYTEFLVRQASQNGEMAATLTVLELPNLFALLDQVQRASKPAATIALSTFLLDLLRMLGRPRLLEHLTQIRNAAALALGETWNHTRFQAERTRIEQHLVSGSSRDALDDARDLLARAHAVGEEAYSGADYDLAMGCFLLGGVLNSEGAPEQGLPLFVEAQKRFEAVAARSQINRGAALMAITCLKERGDCHLLLGQFDEAAAEYEESIARAEQLSDERQVAVGKAQLGMVRSEQRCFPAALAAYEEARQRFTRLGDSAAIAATWHSTAIAHQHAGEPEAAEDAYRRSLIIKVRIGDIAGQAATLTQLGSLYDIVMGRPEDAATFHRQAVDKFVQIQDAANEGMARHSLANALRKLNRLADARLEIHRAIERKKEFGHSVHGWTSWAVLAEIEEADDNRAAAAEAKQKATASYLDYRRDGGENHNVDGRICLEVMERLLADDPAGAASFLEKLASYQQTDWLPPYIQVLHAIVVGSRDRTLADAPDLSYSMAAEILFLLQALERAGK